nr:shikimate kinase [uncultured Flavobacterium sp.]
MNKKIILLGYMGSGKSTIGQILSNATNLAFYDLDKYIEERQQKSIKEIFQTDGEIYFRKIEHQYLNDILNLNEEAIISLGGGTPCYANNHLHFEKENVFSYYLKASIKTLSERLEKESSKRPLLDQNEDDLETFIAKHLFDRSFFYNKARYKINVDTKSTDEIITEIKNTLI